MSDTGAAVVDGAQQNVKQKVPRTRRPLVCTSMQGVIATMSGFQSNREKAEAVDLIHYMGGSVRREWGKRITHLITDHTQTEKFRVAASLGIPCLLPSWVHDAWAHRDTAGFSATTPDFLHKHKVPPFHNLYLTFAGFSDSDLADLITRVGDKSPNGGTVIPYPGNEHTTHFIVDNGHKSSLPPTPQSMAPNSNCHCVTVEWFWVSIQLDLCANETLYKCDQVYWPAGRTGRPQKAASEGATPALNKSTALHMGTPKQSTPTHIAIFSPDKSATAAILATSPICQSSPAHRPSLSSMAKSPNTMNVPFADAGPSPSQTTTVALPPVRSQRRSQMKRLAGHNETQLCLSTGSLIDKSTDGLPDHMFSTEDADILNCSAFSAHKSNLQTLTKRQHVCAEMLQTEQNYLATFKKELEDEETKTHAANKEPLLSKVEMTLIFGKIQPLYDVHAHICSQLTALVSHWNEQRLIGKVWHDVQAELIKAYPPFVNSFDKAKETLIECDRTKPRFHAFLKARESRPECLRQTLSELLIRPVQRLGSVTLLLREVIKSTDKSNADYEHLQMALEAINRVLM